MIEVEYLGGPKDGLIERHPKEELPPWMKMVSKPVSVNNLTGEMLVNVLVYILDSQTITASGYRKGKYLLREQTQEIRMLDDMYPKTPKKGQQ